jgi:hypothetical protein
MPAKEKNTQTIEKWSVYRAVEEELIQNYLHE